MTAVRLMQPFKLILVAAPEYLDVKGTPKEIGDLHAHNRIGLRFGSSGGIFDWELKDGRKTVAVKISGTALVTDPTHALELALAGVGITFVPEPLGRPYLREGRLVWLLPKTAFERDGLFLYHSQRVSQTPKLRAFVEVAKGVLAQT